MSLINSNRDLYEACLEELGRMSRTEFYSRFTYSDVWSMLKGNLKRLASLASNGEFSFKFEADLRAFANYENDLRRSFESARLLRDRSLEVYGRLRFAFGYGLRDTVLRKLAEYLVLDDLP